MAIGHSVRTSESSSTGIDIGASGWHTLEDVHSEVDTEDEDNERDELIKDEEEDDIIILQPPTLSSASDAVRSGDVTRSRVQAPNANSARPAGRVPTTTSADLAPTNDDLAYSTIASAHKHKKRRRRSSASDSEGPHQRPVKKHRSHAPSPPSLPSFQKTPASHVTPPRPFIRTKGDRPYIHRPPTSTLASTSGSPTWFPPVQQHALATSQPTHSNAAAKSTPIYPIGPHRSFVVTAVARALGEGGEAEAPMDVDDTESDDSMRPYSPSPTPEDTPSRDHRPAPLKVVHASWADPTEDEDDPGYNARHSKTILRWLEASERMYGKLRAPVENTSKIIPLESPVSLKPTSVVPPARRTVTWADTTIASGSGNKATGLTKHKPLFKPTLKPALKSALKSRVKTAPTNVDAMSVPTSASTSARAPSETASSAGPSRQPVHFDAPAARADDELQHQAELWAALVRSFVVGRSTRALNHDVLVRSLRDASGAGLSVHILVKSRLYAAVKALGQQSTAEHMFEAIRMARKLAGWWETKFGVKVLETRND